MDDLLAALSRLATSLASPDESARLRLWVDRVFTIKGAGTLVTGALGQGRIAVGDALVGATSERRVRVRCLHACGRKRGRLRRFTDGAEEGIGTGRLQLSRPLSLAIGDRGLCCDPSRHDLVMGI